MPVSIHGKEYKTVAERVQEAHGEKKFTNLSTEVLSHAPVVIKATVTVDGNTYTGISAVSLDTAKQIERLNPYEVAETSAVGRALGFAGYGLIEDIASADEIVKSKMAETAQEQTAKVLDRAVTKIDPPIMKDENWTSTKPEPQPDHVCEMCGEPASEKSGVSKAGKPYRGVFCSTGEKSHVRWLKAV